MKATIMNPEYTCWIRLFHITLAVFFRTTKRLYSKHETEDGVLRVKLDTFEFKSEKTLLGASAS